MRDDLEFMSTRMYRVVFLILIFLLTGCALDRRHKLIVSATDQKMLLFEDHILIATYPISTSKYGLGDHVGSFATPVGKMVVCQKIGDGAPLGMVFKDRKATGEVLTPNTSGRDPIVTRILWLQGKESQNRNAFSRCIYIHGTPQECELGRPASYGCIRMRSSDIAQLYEIIGKGTEVEIVEASFKPQK